jgi:hypothetical protein
MSDDRQFAPATQRNREPILEVLQRTLPSTGTILEIASGTGEHAVFFAPQLPGRKWLPTDINYLSLVSISAWLKHSPSDNIYPPILLDVCANIWSIEQEKQYLDEITAIVSINMIHIAPWAACLGLMAGAGRILPENGILYLYGPFKQNGQHTAPSNAAFDEWLKSQNPEWGVRDLEEVIAVAKMQNLHWCETVSMPANNLSVIFQKI